MEWMTIAGVTLPVYRCETLVIGAGAAGLNAADELAKRNMDVLLAADDDRGGTSRNAGSDKQTYYKLSLSGAADSVDELAQNYFAGGHMDGDTALALAAGSVEAFLKLVQLGVPFPHNEWGEYVGYRTDHDPRNRATSAGPLTSRFMAECLGREVERRQVPRIHGNLVRYLCQDGQISGALFYDETLVTKENPGLLLVLCGQAIACTGGAAMLYEDSVFPQEQQGALGCALRAGAAGQNLWSWQYGLASIGKRWNVSGSYQQVIPRYVDEEGQDVLEGAFADTKEKQDMIFLKGYQWPFDSRKLEGSSRVDEAIYRACAAGKRVFMDFRKEDEADWFENLGEEAQEYLRNCGCDQGTPFERLMHMNPAAVDLYRSFGIDIETEPLEVRVCAQHINGGIAVDRFWQTTVPGLYAAGETAGAFGAYRPGGSALNETQVGSARAVRHIAAAPRAIAELTDEVQSAVQEEARWLLQAAVADPAERLSQLRHEMSLCAAHVRSLKGMKKLSGQVEDWIRDCEQGAGDAKTALILRDCLYAARSVLSAMICHAQELGSSAGHTCVDGKAPAAKNAQDFKVTTSQSADGVCSVTEPVRVIPESGGWFETVWAAYRKGDVNR